MKKKSGKPNVLDSLQKVRRSGSDRFAPSGHHLPPCCVASCLPDPCIRAGIKHCAAMFPLNPRICPCRAQESKGPAAAPSSRLLHQSGCSDLRLSYSIQWKQSLSSLHASISRLDDGWLSDAQKGTVFTDMCS